MVALPSSPAVLALAGIGKTYSAPVLADLDLELRGGEVLALTGENGAGKSTLSRIVAGLVAPSGGTMQLGGHPYLPRSRTEAEALGVRMVLQELSLVPTLTVAENLFLGRWPTRAGWIARRELHARARAALEPVGLADLNPATSVSALGIGRRQMVEIARSLAGECRVLILDEPTAMLSQHESDLLFAQIAALRQRGVALVYITHRLEEIAKVADRVAVLRDGRLVVQGPAADFTPPILVRAMAGREVDGERNEPARVPGETLLRVTGLSRAAMVRDVSFSVGAGEILGIGGLVGSGRTELLRLIFGADRADAGGVELGRPLRPASIASPVDAVRAGLALVSEDRKGEGLLLPQSVAANISLGNSRRISRTGPLGRWIDRRRERRLAEAAVERLRIRCTGTDQPVAELSGGNQQKVMISRWLERDPAVLLFDEPTRGIDVAAKFEVHALLAALARQGKALVVVSSDLSELMQVCDRIAMMHQGRISRTFSRGEWSRARLLAAAFGEERAT